MRSGEILAYEKGIPVVTYNYNISSEKYDYFYATDNYGVAKEVGKIVAHQMGGEGTFAILSGSAGEDTEIKREKGFFDGITENNSNIKMIGSTQFCNYDYNKAYSQSADMLTANPDITAIYSTFCNMAESTAVALQETNRQPKDVINVTFDTTDDTNALTKEGWVTGFVQQDSYNMLKWAIKKAYELGGGQLARTAAQDVATDWILVTPDNFNDADVQAFLKPAG